MSVQPPDVVEESPGCRSYASIDAFLERLHLRPGRDVRTPMGRAPGIDEIVDVRHVDAARDDGSDAHVTELLMLRLRDRWWLAQSQSGGDPRATTPSIAVEVVPAGLVLHESEVLRDDLDVCTARYVFVVAGTAGIPRVRLRRMERYVRRRAWSRVQCEADCMQTCATTPQVAQCTEHCSAACSDSHLPQTIFELPVRWEDARHVVVGPAHVASSPGRTPYFNPQLRDREMRVTLPDCDVEDCLARCVEDVTTTQ